MPRLRLALLAVSACVTSLLAPPPASANLMFTGIRPGTLLLGPNGCTADFVFQDSPGAFDPSGTLYLGTAGHCFDVGAPVLAANAYANSPQFRRIGTVIMNFYPADDFELIQLDSAARKWVSPSTAYVGGPTGVYTGPAGATVTMVGWGGLAGGTPRQGTLATGFDHTAPRFKVTGMPTVYGDSGAPILTSDGLAVGNSYSVDHLQVVPGGLDAGVGTTANGVTLSRMLALTGKYLAVCPTADPWPLAGCPS